MEGVRVSLQVCARAQCIYMSVWHRYGKRMRSLHSLMHLRKIP